MTHQSDQAARIIGEFVNLAREVSQKIDRGVQAAADSANHPDYSDASNPKDYATEEPYVRTEDSTETQRPQEEQFADYFSELRDLATNTMQGFVSAMNVETARPVEPASDHGAINDSTLDDSTIQESVVDAPVSKATQISEQSAQRLQKLKSIFSNVNQIDSLSDKEFAQLHEFMQRNYQSAIELIKKT